MKHLFFLLLFIISMLAIGANVMARDILTEAIIMGDFSCLDDPINREDIQHFSKYDLRLLRNTIFAKNGYLFVSKDLIEHFSRFPWYNNDKANLKKRPTRTDWNNVALIQSLEKNTATALPTDNFSNQHFLKDRIYGFLDGRRVENILFEGEVTASFNLARENIATAAVKDNEFDLDMDNIPLNMLRYWERNYDNVDNWLYCSDPETKLGILLLEITGTMTNLLNGKKKTLSRADIDEVHNYYIYSDRDAIIRGVRNGELYTSEANLKVVWNLVLKKGWNKVKKAYKTNTGKYAISMCETTSEPVYFGVEVDYFYEQPERTIYGKIGRDNHPDLPLYYVLLKKPLRVNMNDYTVEPSFHETLEVQKLILFLDENIDTTFSDEADYIIHGTLSRMLYTMRGEYEIGFFAMEIEIDKTDE